MRMIDAQKQIDNMPSLVFAAKDRSGKGYVCPFCGSGSHSAHGTGVTTKDGVHYTCWSCSKIKNNDILDIYAMINDIQLDKSHYRQKVTAAAQAACITIDNNIEEPKKMSIKKVSENTENKKEEIDNEAEKKLIREDIKKATDGSNTTLADAYFFTRKISPATYTKFGAGAIREYVHPKNRLADKLDFCDKRIIIPTSDCSYVARAIDNDAKIKKINAGHKSLFNAKVLSRLKYTSVLVVEGEIDVMSIYEAQELNTTVDAVGLGGTTGGNLLVKYIKDNKIEVNKPIIIALDNDAAGKKASNEIKKLLDSENIPAQIAADGLWGEKKDANEYLCSCTSQQELTSWCGKLAMMCNSQYSFNVFSDFAKRKKYQEREDAASEAIPTGFSDLDKMLLGGIYNGSVYYIAGLPALGKTTLIHQLGEQIAEQGTNVIYIALEMSSEELYERAISRRTFLKDLEAKTDFLTADYRNIYATSQLDLSSSARQSRFSQRKIDMIEQCKDEYCKNAGSHFFCFESVGDDNWTNVNEILEKYRVAYGKTQCVVLIDYLQLMSNPLNHSATEKQVVDENVKGIKRLARKYDVPVLVISNMSRANYLKKVSFESFKESGAIEYGGDVILGLDLTDIDDVIAQAGMSNAKKKDDDDSNKSSQKSADELVRELLSSNPRRITMTVLKNRKGVPGRKIKWNYFPKYNTFIENHRENTFENTENDNEMNQLADYISSKELDESFSRETDSLHQVVQIDHSKKISNHISQDIDDTDMIKMSNL